MDKDVKVVRLLLPDMFGVPRAKTISAEYYQQKVANGGHGWSSTILATDLWQNLGEDHRLGLGNVLIFPEEDTMVTLPWDRETAVVICRAERDGGPAPTARGALTRVVDDLASEGYLAKLGPELEFTLMTPSGETPFGMNQWYTSEAIALINGFVKDLYRYLPEMGLPLYEVFNEHGAGQMEINLEPGIGVQAIDRAVLMKLAVKEIATQHGMLATFMAKPSNDPEIAASGFHLHQCLVSEGGRLPFAGDDGASALARHYMGGQLAHARGFTIFAASTIVAYKRFQPGTWAPVRAAWGYDNRSAMLRFQGRGNAARVENRLGASDANPYLLAASQLAAGIDGIRSGADAGAAVEGDAGQHQEFAQVPTDLPHAIDAFEADEVLRNALGIEFSELYADVQRLVQRRFNAHVTDWETREYREL